MGKVRITIKISRYQRDKFLGERYRNESPGGESFTEFKKRIESLESPRRKKNKYY